jgi:hypothetical protein
MQFARYVGLLFSRAAQQSVLLTDRLTILLVPFVTLVLWLMGAKMTDTVQETVFVGVAITVLAVVALRFAAASYFVWRDDQKEKGRLQAELDEPSREIERDLLAYTSQTRKELSRALAELAAIANFDPMNFEVIGVRVEKINDLVISIDTYINQLSYDVPLRIASIHLKDYCLDLITGRRSNRERLWAQRKITFRILHKEDRINEILSLAELEVLIEDDEGKHGVFGDNKGVFDDLKEMIRKLGSNFYDDDLVAELRREHKNMTWRKP